MAETPFKNNNIEATDDTSALAEMPLDTGNPLLLIAGITLLVYWFYIHFYGEDGQLLRELEAFGLITQNLQVAADYLHSPWMPIVMITAPVLLMIALYNQIQETYF